MDTTKRGKRKRDEIKGEYKLYAESFIKGHIATLVPIE